LRPPAAYDRVRVARARTQLRLEGVDTDKVAASFKNGVLSVTLPKSAEAQKQAKKIEVKGG
jgi:HSP20 family molecular chaperone IbpA